VSDSSEQTESKAIPAHVRRFLLLNVASVPHLEAMLLLCEDPKRQWDVLRVARRLYMKEGAAAALLADLHRGGIIAPVGETSDAYIYQPSSPEVHDTIRDAAACYTRNLRIVTNLIHSRIAAQAQQFADAFKLRKEP
jgi:hypothetical protein